MSTISTHILCTARGRPAAGLAVHLERQDGDGDVWMRVGGGVTDGDGRVRALVGGAGQIEPGTYRMTFETGPWYEGFAVEAFYPVVHVVFRVSDAVAHYHVPLLLSPFGYSTYRGS